MRSVIRVGATAGVLGCLSMYLVARDAGLVAAIGLVALGIATGLAMAKWLEWSWYGRQLEAGAKSGAFACVPAGLVALGALLLQGPHEVSALAAASHLGPLTAAGLASTFSFAGWVSADILSVLLATALGIVFAAATSALAAWSKSAGTVQKVTQAYEAAQTLRRGTWGPAPTSQMPAFPSSLAAGAAWQGMTPGNGTLPAGAALPSTPYEPTTLPSQRIATAPPVGVAAPDVGQQPANTPTDDDQLRAAMREALAMWGDETGENAVVPGEASMPEPNSDGAEIDEQPTQRRTRNSKASRFLNDSKKKKIRRKADTRDWLC